MSSGEDDMDPEDKKLMASLPKALSAELIPTTEAEVARAEAVGVEFEGALPEGLQEFRGEGDVHAVSQREPPLSQDLSDEDEDEDESEDDEDEDELEDDEDDDEDALDELDAPGSLADVASGSRGRGRPVRPWLTHVAAAALGAAAVATLVIGRTEKHAAPAGSATHAPEPVSVPDAALDAPGPVVLPPPVACGADCCAGKQCNKASPELTQCASGRSCIACTLKDLGAARFRVKLGALAPLDAGRTALDRAAAGSIEVCVRAGGSPEVCTPAHAATSADAPWSSLPLVVSAQDLLAALIVRVRQRGVAAPLAEWQSPVPVSPTVLCRGLVVKPKTKNDDAFGSISLFLDDTHYVEVARSPKIASLSATAARIKSDSLKAKIFETRRGGDQKFALVYGPMAQTEAEKLRWVLLEAGRDARVTLGEDHEGDPKP